MKKTFYVLECHLARRPFFAKSPEDWSYNVNEALKFSDFNSAFYFRAKHPSLKMYEIHTHEFDFDIPDEELFYHDERQLTLDLDKDQNQKT